MITQEQITSIIKKHAYRHLVGNLSSVIDGRFLCESEILQLIHKEHEQYQELVDKVADRLDKLADHHDAFGSMDTELRKIAADVRKMGE